MMLSGLKHIRVIHRLRTALALLAFAAVVTAVGGLMWANHTGLPDSWRTRIERELANRGLHTDIDSLRYHPMRGIEAREVVVYSDQHRSRTIMRIQSLLLDIDRTKLSRGEVEIERIDLSGAGISLAADPADPSSKALDIENATGRIILSTGRQFEVQGASGMVGGVRLELDCVLQKYRPKPSPTPEEIEYSRVQRRRIVTAIIDAIDRWGPESPTPPVVRIRSRGDLEDPANLRASVEILGRDMVSRSLEVPKLDVRAELRGSALVVRHADIRTGDGDLAGRMEFDLWKQSGRFDLNSSLDLTALLGEFGMPMPEPMPTFGKPPTIEVRGSFAKKGDEWETKLIGHAELDQPAFKHLSADHFSSSFSWDGKRLFLEDILLKEGDHQLTGRAFYDGEQVFFQASSDLPIGFWQKSVKIMPLAKVLGDFKGQKDSTISADFKGMVTPGDKTRWNFSGDVAATAISFRGVPAKRGRVTLDLRRERLDFIDGEVEFDYRDYPLRKKHGGPTSGNVMVDRVRYNREPSTVIITNLRGDAWPAPVVRTFSAKIADRIEKYGFHSTPSLVANGVVGVLNRRTGFDGRSKQDLTIRFSSKRPANYEFLGSTLTLGSPKGTVRVLPSQVRISDLNVRVFDGLVRTSFSFKREGPPSVTGEIDWTRLSLPALNKAYDRKASPKGRITGRLDFKLNGERVSGLDGTGHVALEEAELFEVPIFGPLSPVISTVIGNRKAGFQEASEAFCTFNIAKGQLSTLDFQTSTSSIVITGDAVVNLDAKTMRMTLRLNARGLLGVITIPLRPFYGMFQFRGIGPIEKPEWKNVMFTKPPEQQEKTLLEPPKARRIEPAGGRAD